MQLTLAPVCLLYSTTLQNIKAPDFKLGLFLLVAPSNYSPPRMPSMGAPMSTIKVYAVLTLTTPMTKSFLAGKYCTGNLVRVVESVLEDTEGNPENKEIRPSEQATYEEESNCFLYNYLLVCNCPANKNAPLDGTYNSSTCCYYFTGSLPAIGYSSMYWLYLLKIALVEIYLIHIRIIINIYALLFKKAIIIHQF